MKARLKAIFDAAKEASDRAQIESNKLRFYAGSGTTLVNMHFEQEGLYVGGAHMTFDEVQQMVDWLADKGFTATSTSEAEA